MASRFSFRTDQLEVIKGGESELCSALKSVSFVI